MPVHDWTRVDAGIFHHFHHSWIEEIARALNRGLLPPPFYAMAEQIAGGLGPDVLALEGPGKNGALGNDPNSSGGIALATAAPRVQFRVQAERNEYARKANVVRIRHRSDHRVVAVVEIVSPGNKAARNAMRAFVQKAVEMLEGGVHLLLVDILPPGARDLRGIHDAVWQEYGGEQEFVPPAGMSLTLVSYRAGDVAEAFVEPTSVGQVLIEMPVFLTPEVYVLLPLEATYMAAWEAVPGYWRDVIEGRTTG